MALYQLGVSSGSIKVCLPGCGLLGLSLLDLPWSLCLQVGDAIPSVEVFEGEPGKKVNLAELFKGKKGVLFGVPGAFTPACSEVRFLLSRIRNWDQECGREGPQLNLTPLSDPAGGSTVKITWDLG